MSSNDDQLARRLALISNKLQERMGDVQMSLLDEFDDELNELEASTMELISDSPERYQHFYRLIQPVFKRYFRDNPELKQPVYEIKNTLLRMQEKEGIYKGTAGADARQASVQVYEIMAKILEEWNSHGILNAQNLAHLMLRKCIDLGVCPEGREISDFIA